MATKSAYVVSIDAWREPEGGWTWNDQYKLCDVDPDDFKRLETPRKVCRLLRDYGYLSEHSTGSVRVDYSGSYPE